MCFIFHILIVHGLVISNQLSEYAYNIQGRAPTRHGYTQIVSKMGFTNGQLQIESETYQ